MTPVSCQLHYNTEVEDYDFTLAQVLILPRSHIDTVKWNMKLSHKIFIIFQSTMI